MLYQDQLVQVTFPADAAVTGHVLIQPRRDVKLLCDLSAEESGHLFLVASYASAILFQGLQAEGTNIIVEEGGERLTAHVLARMAGDGLSFAWQPLKLDETVMSDLQERIKEKAFLIGKVRGGQQSTVKLEETRVVAGRGEKTSPPESTERSETRTEGSVSTNDAQNGASVVDREELSEEEENENYLIQQLIRIP